MKFSVLMSVYVKEDALFLHSALQSVVSQTLLPEEIILVKDGPLNDKLDKVIENASKKSSNIKIVELKENMGLSYSLNEGIKFCTTEWIARMDSDDIALPERFEVTVNFIQQHLDADIVGAWAYTVDRNNINTGILKVPTDPYQIKDLIWTCPIIHPTVFYKRESIIQLGGYNPKAGPRQDDYDLWFRCAKAGYRFYNIPIPLLNYRFLSSSILKNDFKVGWARLKVGLKGCYSLRSKPLAYVGVCIPFIRSLLPYPLNIWFYRVMDKFNPRKNII